MGTSVNTNTTAVGATNVPISTEIIAGDALQRIKLVIGALGVDGGDISAANPLPASIASLPLPAGAATETTLATVSGKLITGGPQLGSGVVTSTTQRVTLATDGPEVTNTTAIKNSVASMDTKAPALVSGRVPVDGSGVTQPISAASLPLPTGAATEATLSTLNGKIPATVAGSQPVTLRDASGTAILVSAAGSLSVTNEVLTASGNITTQNLVPAGTATAGSAVELTLSGGSTIAIQTVGTYTGPLSMQLTLDGTNWKTVGGTPFIDLNTGLYLATITSALQSVFQCEAAGAIKARITGLAAMTGTATVTIRAIQGAAAMVALDAALPAGAAIIGALVANQSTNVAQINGVTPLMGNGTTGTGSPRVTIASDNTAFTVNLGTGGTGATNLGKAEDNAHTSADVGTMALGVRTDVLAIGTGATGRYGYLAINRFNAALTSDFRQNARTYSAAANVAVAVTATDIFDLFGNATSTVVITKVIITGIQTTAGQIDFLAIKRSTANSVGTRAAMTVVPHDASDSAANSTPGTYTANPTIGTAVGSIRRAYIPITAAATALQGTVEFSFGTTGKGITLSGTAQGLCLNLNGATITGGTFDISVEWYEF